MVAKLLRVLFLNTSSLNLAKIHMVAKQSVSISDLVSSLNLAKIHMVAKLTQIAKKMNVCLNLAKIHMVAKPK